MLTYLSKTVFVREAELNSIFVGCGVYTDSAVQMKGSQSVGL